MRLEEENKSKTADSAVSERLYRTRSLVLSGEVNKEMADRFIKDLLILENDSSDAVRVFIDSPGGDVDSGFAIYDMIRFVSCPVTLIGSGLVASAAALILLAVPSQRRVGLPNSSYLIHQPLSQMRGNATEIEIHAKQLELCKARINRIIADATGKSLEKVSADTDRDYWLDAHQAVDYGLISRIVSKRSDLS